MGRCDLFGNCATQNSLSLARSASALVATRAAATLNAAVTEPTQGQHVAAGSGEIGVVVSADALAFIQTATLYLGGVLVDVQIFAENEKKSSFVGLIRVAVSGEITHSLRMEVKDWANATQPSNVVAFFLDTAPPLLTLDITSDNKGTIWGTATTPLAVPVQPLPVLPADFAPGTENLNLPRSTARQLAAGTYDTLVAGKDATVVLSGGLYHFQSWELDAGAKVFVQRATEIRIAGRVLIAKDSYLGPDPSAKTMTAGEIVLYVAGTNGKEGEIKDEPAAVDLGEKGKFLAYIVAPNGTILLGENASATGSLIGRWVDVLSGVRETDAVGAAQAADATATTLSNAESENLDIPAAISLANTSITSGADGVRVVWESAVEVEVVGFYLVRVGVDDIEERIAPELIPTQSVGQTVGGVYTFLDTSPEAASAGVSYILDVLLFDGQVQRVEIGQAAAYNYQLFLPTTNR